MWRYEASQPVIGSTPAAGQPFTYTPSFAAQEGVAQHERIEALTFELVTSSHASSRIVLVEFLDGSGVPVAVAGAPFTQGLTLTTVYSFFVGGAQFGANNAAAIGAPLPALWLDSRVTVSIGAAALDSGDQFGNVRLYVCRRWRET